jgi:hypothetical protein
VLILSAALAFALMAVQFAAIALSPWELLVRLTLPLTIAGVPIALWPHRRHVGLWVMFVGLVANLAVVLANGGLMPIERSTVASAAGEARAAQYPSGGWMHGSKDVLTDAASARGIALGDSIVIRIGGGGLVASPGDIVIWAGLAVLAGEAAIGSLRRATQAANGSNAKWKWRGDATTH